MLAVVAACAAACRGDARTTAPGDPPTLRIGTFTKSRAGWLAGFLASEPLVSVSWDGRPVYRLAESIDEAPDGFAFHVTLRPDVRFHSGEAVTAARVAGLLSRKILRPRSSSGISAIEATGERTLVIRLERARSLEVVDLGDVNVDDDDKPEVRTGPFRISTLGPPAVLERFTEYHQGVPGPGRVEIHEYDSHRAAWTAMLRGDVNFLQEVSRDAIDFVEAGGHVRAYPLLRPFTVTLAFNVRHPFLRHEEVRIALNEAIDREEAVRTGMRGHGQPAESPFWPHHWAYPRTLPPLVFNPKAAALRLDAAGLPVRTQGPDAMPSRFAFSCLLVAGDTRFERIALVVRRQLFEIGVDMRLTPVASIEDLQRRVLTGDFDAFMYEMASGRTLRWPYRFWHSGAAMLPTGYSAADAALDRMKLGRTDDEVRQALAEVLHVFRANPPAAFLAFPREVRAVDRSFDVPYEPDRDVFGTLWQFKPAPLRAERVP